MRPKIHISPYICHRKFGEDYFFVFKIVNRSLFSTYDVNIELSKLEPYLVNKGQKTNHRITPINISTNYINHISSSKREKGYGKHARLIRTNYNIGDDIRDNNITVQLSVCCKHGLTNLTRIVNHQFLSSDVIYKDKEFRFGKHLDVY